SVSFTSANTSDSPPRSPSTLYGPTCSASQARASARKAASSGVSSKSIRASVRRRVTGMRTIKGIEELKQLAGQQLGSGDWHEVTQEQINQFADATGDHQWIHTDVER